MQLLNRVQYSTWHAKRVVWTSEIIGFAKPDEDSLTDAIPLSEIHRIQDHTEIGEGR